MKTATDLLRELDAAFRDAQDWGRLGRRVPGERGRRRPRPPRVSLSVHGRFKIGITEANP